MKKINEMLKEIVSSPTEELGRWSRFVWFQVQLWPHCAKLLKRNRSGQQAAALSYHTMFGIVPLAIIVLMVFQLFPAYSKSGEKAKKALYDYFNLSTIEYPVDERGNLIADDTAPKKTVKLTDKIDEITGRFTSNLNKGAITLFSCIIVLWAAIGLLTTIERSFNSIWHVPRGRNILHRTVNYWALLTFGPIMLILGFYINTRYLVSNGFHDGLIKSLQPLGPYVITVAAMFFLYFLLPNTRVSVKAAIWGAAVAAIVWTGAKALFGIYVIKFIPQWTVYGVMGIIPLGVFWIYITWFIVLFGLQLTYATQNLKSLNAEEIRNLKKEEEYFLVTDLTVIRIMAFIVEVFDRGKGAVSARDICSKFSMPTDFVERILVHLVEKKLLLRVAEPEGAVVLAVEADNISLADISEAVLSASFVRKDEEIPARLRKVVDDRSDSLSRCSLRDLNKI